MKQTRLNSALLPKRKSPEGHQKTHRLMFIQLLMTLMALPLVSGCSMMSVYEGVFDCEPGRGVCCKSISEVNDMMNQGQLPPQTKADDDTADTDAESQNHDQNHGNRESLRNHNTHHNEWVRNQKTCHSCQTNSVKSDEEGEGGIWWSSPLWVEAHVQMNSNEHTHMHEVV